MKKLLVLCLCLAFANIVDAQTFDVNLSAKVVKEYLCEKSKNTYKTLKVGDSIYVKLLKIDSKKLTIQTQDDFIEVSDEFFNSVVFGASSIEELWNSQIFGKVYPEIYMKKDAKDQEKLVAEMDLDVDKYVSTLKDYNLQYYDPYIYNYIYSLITKIMPLELIDGRPTNIHLLIVEDLTPNASMCHNGTLIINTGLLSALRSEDELVAVLCHEMAHYVLAHSVRNVNKMLTRKKHAAFWGALATGLTAVAEGVAASNGNYVPGLATTTVALTSTAIASEVVDYLGMKYDKKQEAEADEIACRALSFLGYSTDALATALQRCENAVRKSQHINHFYLSESESDTQERIAKCGTPDLSIYQRSYDVTMSQLLTKVALANFECGRFRMAERIADVNIANEVALPTDYLVKVNCILSMYDSPDMYEFALGVIEKAKSVYPDYMGLMKAEILVYIRLNDFAKAKILLAQYDDYLRTSIMRSKDIPNDLIWTSTIEQYNVELEWVKGISMKLATK